MRASRKSRSRVKAPDGRGRVVVCAALLAGAILPIAARAQQAPSSQPASASQPTPSVQEIIVTAQFREQAVDKVGASIRAFGSEDLRQLGINSVADLAKLTPSLNLQDRGPNRNEISIRGIGREVFQQDLTLSAANIGLYYDDVPINLPLGVQLDVPSFDLNRVEVLRGPQGTVFGEGAEGGAIQYFSEDPSLDRFGGIVEAYGNTTAGGAAAGGGRLAVGIPIVKDQLGLRLVVDHEALGGYIYNSADNQKDSNPYQATDVRAVLLWKPNSRFAARIMATYQTAHQNALDYVSDAQTATLAGFSTANNYVNDHYYIVSGKLTYDFGPISVESITSYYNRDRSRDIWEPVYTGQYSLIGNALGVPGTRQTNEIDDTKYDQISEELRFISHFNGSFNFVAGAFYRHFSLGIQSYLDSQELQAVAPAYAALLGVPAPTDPSAISTVLAGQLGLNTAPSFEGNESNQISGFIEGTYDVTSKLRFVVGVRKHYERLTATGTPGGWAYFETLGPGVDFRQSTTANAFLPHVSIEYKPISGLMLYGSFSEGLRNGNLNASGAVAAAAQLEPDLAGQIEVFGPEYVYAYEIGVKGSLLNHRATYDVAGFYNYIKDLQGYGDLDINGAVTALIENVGHGHTDGFEAEGRFALTHHLSLFAGGNYTEAEVDQLNTSDPLVAATVATVPGQPIPFIPKYTVSAGVEGQYPLGSTGWSAFGNATYKYVDKYSTFFEFTPGSPEDPILGGYALTNLDAGVKKDQVSIDVRVDNLFDRRVIISDSPVQALFTSAGLKLPPGASIDDLQMARPRTIVVTLRATF